eukprot:gnl/TRDRNA2_/TRDRNA2_121687_c0_seq2.p1 gnl/TRDRNA2_/TRDRNA2_121687_c0~~gnl/TRDRNA2_/TRDRNA2_121687_c0_seq2.p1  ORF type:complete len:110 (-),score=20.71 gnl/TRDRNA2_/TRDRNA2_121687_c0_seq2:38-367(-)
MGFIQRLLYELKEQEVKEAILAYWTLMVHTSLDETQLQAHSASFLLSEFGTQINFRGEEALAKLVADGLATCTEDGMYKAIPVRDATDRMRRMWQCIFLPQQSNAATVL